MTGYDALHKGSRGVNYRTQIGLHRSAPSGGATATSPTDPMWDVYVGPLPFLIAPSADRPYLRESSQPRRERLDQARDPGENSLDSGLWVRSQTSWHLGAGQAYAEPLEGSPDVARFRFHDSVGIDPWTKGQLSLLPSTAQRDTGARKCVGVPGVGLLVSTASAGVRLYPSSGASTQLSTKTITGDITATATKWFGVSSSGIEYGLLAGGGEGQAAKTGITALNVAKDRLWCGVGAELYEITSMSPPAFTTAMHTFRSGSIVDIDAGAAGTYVMVNDAFTTIYVITAKDDGTLNAPREVATLPRGETGNFLYGYLGRYLIIGTNKGLRVADCSSGGELPIGPLIEVTGGCVDAVGDGTFVWFTGAAVQPDVDVATTYPALWRLDLSAPISSVAAYGDSAAAKYAYATDMWAATTGAVYSVTTYGGDIYMVAGSSSSGSPLWQESATLVAKGWLTSGQVSYSTSERKTWASMSVDIAGAGYFAVQAASGAAFDPVTQTEIAVPHTGDLDLDATVHEPGGWFEHRIELVSSGGTGTPIVYSLGLRATPAPRRTRYLRFPLECYDRQLDRYNNPVGYEGFGYDRIRDLEDLEQAGGLITILDQRTGESIRCQIEKVSFAGESAPSKSMGNFSGVVTLTVLTV